ncbi:zinc-finger double domain-containing protein [Phthorimaea operculella]|nr:zinc-finger double domain-containing protein [Phthorimaea operculella]
METLQSLSTGKEATDLSVKGIIKKELDIDDELSGEVPSVSGMQRVLELGLHSEIEIKFEPEEPLKDEPPDHDETDHDGTPAPNDHKLKTNGTTEAQHTNQHTADDINYFTIKNFESHNSYLQAQIRKQTGGDKPYACNVCDKKFNLKSHLNAHNIIHTGKMPYACDVCGKRFKLKSNLRTHIVIHTGEKPYACEICDKKFARKSSLENHKRIHTGEKPYACEICETKFGLKANLDRHKRIMHTGDKPYACEICGKKFNVKGNLIEHIRIHTGEKPFACEICEKEFTQKSSLERHKRIHTYLRKALRF